MSAAYCMVLLALSGSLALMNPMLFTCISSFTLKLYMPSEKIGGSSTSNTLMLTWQF